MDASYVPRIEREPASAAYSRGAATRCANFAFQALAVLATVLGGWYLAWRWTSSLNPDALGVLDRDRGRGDPRVPRRGPLLPLHLARRGSRRAAAATDGERHPRRAAPARPADQGRRARSPPTTSRSGSCASPCGREAARVPAPDRRCACTSSTTAAGPRCGAMADEEGVGYLTRATNEGYKAGNLRNGLEHTDGDLVVICDADTRPLPALLEETLGYFRDPDVAWVQTPQWFYDIDPGRAAPGVARGPRPARARGARRGPRRRGGVGPVAVGADPLGSDPRAFYDVIQRCRNWCNAAFCCGAGSVHRREAVMEGAVTEFGAAVAAAVRPLAARGAGRRGAGDARDGARGRGRARASSSRPTSSTSPRTSTRASGSTPTPRRWRSVYHPRVLTRMLSPQDLLAWSIQRFKYASGTLDIALHDNPLAAARPHRVAEGDVRRDHLRVPRAALDRPAHARAARVLLRGRGAGPGVRRRVRRPHRAVPRREPPRLHGRHVGRADLAQRAVPPRLVLAEPPRARPRRRPAAAPVPRHAQDRRRRGAPSGSSCRTSCSSPRSRSGSSTGARSWRSRRRRPGRRRPTSRTSSGPPQRRLPRPVRRSRRSLPQAAARRSARVSFLRGLLAARSHLAFLVGLAAAVFAVHLARRARRAAAAPAAGFAALAPERARCRSAAALAARSRRAALARAAWSYFERNTDAGDRAHRLGGGLPVDHDVGHRLAAHGDPRGGGPRPHLRRRGGAAARARALRALRDDPALRPQAPEQGLRHAHARDGRRTTTGRRRTGSAGRRSTSRASSSRCGS